MEEKIIIIVAYKGQEISKGNYGVFNSSKNEPKISDLASKKRSNQKYESLFLY